MNAWKPLLPWGTTTVCGAVVETVVAAGLVPVLVAGYRAPELEAAFADRARLEFVLNRDWERGMLGSVRAGARRVAELSLAEGGFEGFFVAPADMPGIPEAAFAAVYGAVRRRKDGDEEGDAPRAVFASRNGALGHPVWVPAAFMPDMEGLDPGSRLRDFLLERAWSSVEADDDGIFEDVDTPDAYAASLEAVSRRSVGNTH